MKASTKLFALAVAVLGFSQARAAEFVAPKEGNGELTIALGESHKNLYIAGGKVVVNARTEGDLTAAGGKVVVNGSVEKDLIAAGGSLQANGPIGSSAKLLGGSLVINAAIAGDLVAGGGEITLTDKGSVGGDILVSGGTVSINGPVRGLVKIRGGEVTINSRVSGNVDAQVSGRLSFGPKAVVLGAVSYRAPSTASVNAAARINKIEFVQSKMPSLGPIFVAAFLIKLLAWFLVAWLLLHFGKSRIQELLGSVRKRPWAMLGWGALFSIAIPLVALLLLMSAVGYYVALLLIAGFGLVVFLTSPLGAIFMGDLLFRRFHRPLEKHPAWQTAAVGVLIYQVLLCLPIVGWLAIAAVFCMVLGAIIKRLQQRVQQTN